MPNPFAWDTNYSHWNTPSEFAAHLAGMSPASWIRKFVIHHTWSPTVLQWKGVQSMKGLETYYRDQVEWYDEDGHLRKGWWSAPHLFVCLGASKPEYNGIFQGTPINIQGTHAASCNPVAPGIEVVGDFDKVGWSGELQVFMLDLMQVLCKWSGVAAGNVVGHRECGSPKSCPGSKVDMTNFRGQLGAVLNTDKWSQWGDEYPLPADQRGFGIPSAWNPAMLGKAKSFPVYKDGPKPGQTDMTVTQLFEKGFIWFRSGKAHIVLYDVLA